jgi:hypothetical protein
MSKHRPTTVTAEIESIFLSAAVYILSQFLLSFLAVRGVLSEARLPVAQVIICALSAFCGSRFAVQMTSLGTMAAAMLSAGTFAAFITLTGLLAYGGLSFAGEGGALLIAALAGGVIAGLMRRGKKRKKRRGGKA